MIDTASKRFSMLNLGMPWRGPAFIADGSVDQGDRQAVLNYYSGLPFSAPILIQVIRTIGGKVTHTVARGGRIRMMAQRKVGSETIGTKPLGTALQAEI